MSAHFEDRILIIGRILGQKQDLQLFLIFHDYLFKRLQFGFRKVFHLPVGSLVRQYFLKS